MKPIKHLSSVSNPDSTKKAPRVDGNPYIGLLLVTPRAHVHFIVLHCGTCLRGPHPETLPSHPIINRESAVLLKIVDW